MDTKIGIGIIGYGYMGYFHRCKIEKMDNMELIGIYDTDMTKKEQAIADGLKVFDKLNDLMSDDNIMLIIITTPNDSHYEYAMCALKSGKHVLCEKPAMLSVKELDEVLAVADENGRIFTAHQNRRWDKDFSVVKKVVQNRQIGEVFSIYSETYGQRGVCFGWRADPARGGGMLYDWGIHLIDQLIVLFPDIRVTGVNANLRSILTPAVDDYIEIELEMEEDIIAHINIGTFALQNRPRWYVFGDKGTLRLDDFSGDVGGMARVKSNVRFFSRVKKGSNQGPNKTMAHLERQDYDDIPLPGSEDDSLGFYQNLQSALLGEEEIIVKPNEMRRVMEIIEKVFESSKKQERLKVWI